MAAKKKRAAATKKAEVTLASALPGVLEELARAKSLALRDLAKRVPRAEQLALYDALIEAGYEVGAKAVRAPLEGQLAALLSADPIPFAALPGRLAGVTATEVKTTVAELERRGRAARVLHEGKLAVVAAGDALLEARGRDELARALEATVKELRAAKTKKVGVLRGPLADRLASLLARLGGRTALAPSAAAPSAAAPPAARSRDLAALVAAHREPSGLTSVPRLVRLLGGAAARGDVHAELLREARAGRFELRPESGMGRLGDEDRSFCIPGPQGSLLSWVRRLDEERA